MRIGGCSLNSYALIAVASIFRSLEQVAKFQREAFRIYRRKRSWQSVFDLPAVHDRGGEILSSEPATEPVLACYRFEEGAQRSACIVDLGLSFLNVRKEVALACVGKYAA